MANRYVTAVQMPSYDSYAQDDNYNPRQSKTNLPSKNIFISFSVCKTKDNLRDFINIEIPPSDTIEQLKEKIAHHLNIDLPLKKFFLEVLDKNQDQWITINDSNSSITINQLTLSPGSMLSVEYHDQQASKDRRSVPSTSVSNKNYELILKLCTKPMNRTDYRHLYLRSSSTLGKLRKQVYEELDKPPKNHPIFVWNKDSWMKFDSDMDGQTLVDLTIESHAFVSVDYDEKNISSKTSSGLCGLANLGSTCFMNSVFQCLSNTPEFTNKILAFNDEVNAPIIGEYIKLIKRMWSEEYRFIESSSLLNNIHDSLPRYTSNRQQDAQEFMNHFLHLIHAEFSTKESLITDLFYGQIRSTVRCLGCQQIEITNESISFLPLPISNQNQKTIPYIKADGEQRLISIQVNSSAIDVGDLIDCFIKQHELALTKERIQAIELVDNRTKKLYETWSSLRNIRDDELAFLECPKKSSDQKYIMCDFLDHSTGKSFRPSSILVCPIQGCYYTDLSDQIDQLLGNLCSITGAPGSACHRFWKNKNEQQYQLSAEENIDEKLPNLRSIIIEMDTEWVDIYKELLHGDYHCLKCPKPTKARQKSDLSLPLPRVLTIQLKRFTYDVYSNDKIDTFISFPLDGLDLNEYIVKDDNNNNKSKASSSTKYDLVAVSNHTGSLTSGHYTTYAKNIQDKKWYSFDDKIVRQLNSDTDVVTKNAYILIYVQKI